MAEAASPLLQVSDVTAGFGATPVLFDVGLELRPGALVALIGATGAGKSKLLMIDEPSLGLAPKVVDRVMEIVKTINQDGTAVLLVEQDVVLALEIADRGYVLENGRIAMSGPAANLRQDPAVRKAYLGI